ncbi:MAG TPA: sce7725 family protein [Pyrinomonadaceae bacterium]|jgi:hypothetical protein|nr:sce7725 family protein [Pyrinomonadaceae bacterium]
MYFPYLRGKKHELQVLNTAAIWLAKQQKITPILEPVTKDPKPFQESLKCLNRLNVPCIIIVNPQVGELIEERVFDLISSSELADSPLHLAYILNYRTILKDVKDFLKQASPRKISIIHAAEFRKPLELNKLCSEYASMGFQIFIDGESGHLYQQKFINRILIRDSFRKAEKNIDYAKRQDEYFSDWHLQYKKLGLAGFGDYSVIGKDFKSGGPAYAVAIHCVYRRPAENGDHVWIRHFLSDSMPDSTANPGGKFAEALEKLIEMKNPAFNGNHCDGCIGYRSLHSKGAYKGLGLAKELSISHHLNLMKDLLI